MVTTCATLRQVSLNKPLGVVITSDSPCLAGRSALPRETRRATRLHRRHARRQGSVCTDDRVWLAARSLTSITQRAAVITKRHEPLRRSFRTRWEEMCLPAPNIPRGASQATLSVSQVQGLQRRTRSEANEKCSELLGPQKCGLQAEVAVLPCARESLHLERVEQQRCFVRGGALKLHGRETRAAWRASI